MEGAALVTKKEKKNESNQAAMAVLQALKAACETHPKLRTPSGVPIVDAEVAKHITTGETLTGAFENFLLIRVPCPSLASR